MRRPARRPDPSLFPVGRIVGAGFVPRALLRLAPLQVVAQGRSQAIGLSTLGRFLGDLCWLCRWRRLGHVPVPLDAKGLTGGRAPGQCRGGHQWATRPDSGGAACGRPGVHQAVKGLDIQTMAPVAPITLPQPLQAYDHGTLPRGPIAGADIRGSNRRKPRAADGWWISVRDVRSMAESWKFHERRPGTLTFPGLALADRAWHVRAAFGGRLSAPGPGAAVAQW